LRPCTPVPFASSSTKSSEPPSFDPGVARHLANASAVQPRSRQFGEAFEHLLFHELESARAYGLYESLHYWRSTSQHEVDFILDESIAVEVKAAATIGPYELRGLRAIEEESRMRRLLVVALVDRPQRHGDIDVIPYREFLARLWRREL
jgi:predicted AAA+ superfamily ATPase